MRTMDDNVLHGILLEDVAVTEAADDVAVESPGALDVLTMWRSFVGPFAVTIGSSFLIRNGAIVVWLMTMFAGLYFLVRRMSIAEGAIVAVVYIPLMTWIFIWLLAAVPSGFHIVI